MDDINKTEKTLLLLPNYIGIKHPDAWLPLYFRKELNDIELIFCESFKSADALLDRQNMMNIELYEVNEHTQWKKQEGEVLDLLMRHKKVGVISDAGLPCIADPGEQIVALAHSLNYKILPLPGANSQILALAASGLNGEQFSFNGYLPIDLSACKQKVVNMSQLVKDTGVTQLFMETPYRNEKLFTNLINWLPDSMYLCIAADILGRESYIKTKSIGEWNIFYQENVFKKYIGKKPAVFLIGKI